MIRLETLKSTPLFALGPTVPGAGGAGGPPAPLAQAGAVALPPDTSAFGSAEYSLNRSSSARNDASITFERSGLEAPLVGDGIGTSCRALHRLHLDERHETKVKPISLVQQREGSRRDPILCISI